MRAMRIVVLFDLPTGSKAERRTYAEFRKFLVSDGFTMDQFSVYSRATLGRDSMDVHIRRIKANLPAAGRVTVFCMTEKQYENRLTLVCTEGYRSRVKDVGSQLTLIL